MQETLTQMVMNGISQREIANQLGYSLGGIRHHLRKYGLKTVKTIDTQCKACGVDLLNNRYTHHSLCKRCENVGRAQRQRQQKQRAVEYKGGKCVMCGYHRNLKAMQFHHVDGISKDKVVTRYLRSVSWERCRRELDKCTLVCANCHCEIHDEL